MCSFLFNATNEKIIDKCLLFLVLLRYIMKEMLRVVAIH